MVLALILVWSGGGGRRAILYNVLSVYIVLILFRVYRACGSGARLVAQQNGSYVRPA
jgi:hypothetical protein